MLKVTLVALKGGVLVLEAVRGVDRDLPFFIGAEFAAFEHEPAGVSHHRTRRAELRGTMCDPRHIEHERSEDVAPRTQMRREIEGLVEVMVYVALGGTTAEERAVAVEKITAVGGHVNLAALLCPGGAGDFKCAPKHAHLIVRRRRVFRRLGGVRALRGPNPRGTLDKRE